MTEHNNEHNEHHSHGHHSHGDRHEHRPKEDTLTIKKDTLWKGAAGIFAILFVVSLMGGINFGGGGNAVAGGGGAPSGGNIPPTELAAVDGKALIEDNDPVLGSADAEITIIEFSDFQCPFCARAHTGALATFKSTDAFKNGEINLVYKHLPLNSIHPYAQKAAEASECANRQGEFWKYHDTLFANQGSLDIASLKTYASQIGLDVGEFNSCLDNGDASSEVNKETAQATSAGGRGTPFFVIVNNDNGKSTTVSGAVPWTNFEAKISAVK